MKKYILALDQGTSSSRAIIFDKAGKVVSVGRRDFQQIYPSPGWVEHNPMDILNTQVDAVKDALKNASIKADDIAAAGITNQRETTIMWERHTGKPIYNAIVWQCRRTAGLCEELGRKLKPEFITQKTGLILDAYFSATKVKWILENVPGIKKRAEDGDICFGTVDSWLIYNLTGGLHYTDPSNASRTLLFSIKGGKWDEELLKIFGIPNSILPEIKKSSGNFGKIEKEWFGVEIPIMGVAGDQQASLFGQGCFGKGNIKNTYGTGCFMLANTGHTLTFSRNGLLTTVAWDIGRGLEYALEGSVFIGGALVHWLRDEMRLIDKAEDIEQLALSVKDSGGVVIVPAFVGLGAPYWDPDARGMIAGITRGTSRGNIARAALESIAYQTTELIDSFNLDLENKIKLMKVDGGASVNNTLMQIQADISGLPVIRPAISETTAFGAACLAGLGCGFWKNTVEIKLLLEDEETFKPSISQNEREYNMQKWRLAVRAARLFKPGGEA